MNRNRFLEILLLFLKHPPNPSSRSEQAVNSVSIPKSKLAQTSARGSNAVQVRFFPLCIQKLPASHPASSERARSLAPELGVRRAIVRRRWRETRRPSRPTGRMNWKNKGYKTKIYRLFLITLRTDKKKSFSKESQFFREYPLQQFDQNKRQDKGKPIK